MICRHFELFSGFVSVKSDLGVLSGEIFVMMELKVLSLRSSNVIGTDNAFYFLCACRGQIVV